MSLKRKIYAENQKKVVEGKIAVRRGFLKEKGLDSAVIQRDVLIRKMKAEIRKANYRLASIAAQEKLNADKAQVKAEKLAAERAPVRRLRRRPPRMLAERSQVRRKKEEKKKVRPPGENEVKGQHLRGEKHALI